MFTRFQTGGNSSQGIKRGAIVHLVSRGGDYSFHFHKVSNGGDYSFNFYSFQTYKAYKVSRFQAGGGAIVHKVYKIIL